MARKNAVPRVSLPQPPVRTSGVRTRPACQTSVLGWSRDRLDCCREIHTGPRRELGRLPACLITRAPNRS
jgi:hypothetical protein